MNPNCLPSTFTRPPSRVLRFALGLTVATPDQYRGRILSADFALVTLTMSVSFVLAGVMADHLGSTVAILVFAAVAMAWGFFYLRLTNRLEPTEPTG